MLKKRIHLFICILFVFSLLVNAAFGGRHRTTFTSTTNLTGSFGHIIAYSVIVMDYPVVEKYFQQDLQKSLMDFILVLLFLNHPFSKLGGSVMEYAITRYQIV